MKNSWVRMIQQFSYYVDLIALMEMNTVKWEWVIQLQQEKTLAFVVYLYLLACLLFCRVKTSSHRNIYTWAMLTHFPQILLIVSFYRGTFSGFPLNSLESFAGRSSARTLKYKNK